MRAGQGLAAGLASGGWQRRRPLRAAGTRRLGGLAGRTIRLFQPVCALFQPEPLVFSQRVVRHSTRKRIVIMMPS